MNRPTPQAVITTAFLRYGLGLCAAAALLAGCGGSQSPLSVSPQGLAPQAIRSDAYDILHEFGVSPGDGTYPTAELINVKGTMYGTTSLGGSHGLGTVFSITKSGQEIVLHSFGGSPDGCCPVTGLLNVNGTLYGTTPGGGQNGSGTVFSITPGGSEKIIHSFAYNSSYARNSGSTPLAGLADLNGTLYGTTYYGGAHLCNTSYFCGTVFSITTGGKYKVIHNFTWTLHDGYFPQAALVPVNGTLYGTTTLGGKYDRGAVFSISTTGHERMLYSFGSGPDDGSNPTAPVIDVNGMLYGTTSGGGGGGSDNGTVYSITTDGVENVVYRFDGSHGSGPLAGLIDVRGVLYSTTIKGGAKNVGTVFSVTTGGEERVLHSFRAGGGKSPRAALLELGGTLYSTAYGATFNKHGNVFSLTP